MDFYKQDLGFHWYASKSLGQKICDLYSDQSKLHIVTIKLLLIFSFCNFSEFLFILYTLCFVYSLFCTHFVLYTVCFAHTLFCIQFVLYTVCFVHTMFCIQFVLYTVCFVHTMFSTVLCLMIVVFYITL